MKVKPVKEKKSISYPKLAVLTAAVSLSAALNGCVEYQDMPTIGDNNHYFNGTSGDESSEVTLQGVIAVSEDCSSSDRSEDSKCESKENCSDTSSEVTIMSEVAITGEVPESSD